MIPFLPGFSSLGIGVNYGLSKRLDAFAEFSILPVAFKDETFNFHSTGGVRFYLSPKTNSFYLEAGGGLFGGISNDGSGIMPAATGNFGYEFEVKRFTMNVDLGVFYFLDSFISFPLPAVTASFFF